MLLFLCTSVVISIKFLHFFFVENLFFILLLCFALNFFFTLCSSCANVNFNQQKQTRIRARSQRADMVERLTAALLRLHFYGVSNVFFCFVFFFT